MDKATITKYIGQKQEHALLSAEALQESKDAEEARLHYYWRGYYKGLEHLKSHIDGEWDKWDQQR